MGGRRSTKEELTQIEALTKEGLTTKQIAQRLDRSEAGIRNLRYRKNLVKKTEDETKILFQKRDELRSIVQTLQRQRSMLAVELDGLRKEKQKLETIINLDKIVVQQTLDQALRNLKLQRSELFTISGEEQMARLLGEFLKRILT